MSADYQIKIDQILVELTKICEQNKRNAIKLETCIEPPVMCGDLNETMSHWVKNRPSDVKNINLIYVDTIEFLYTGGKVEENDISEKNLCF